MKSKLTSEQLEELTDTIKGSKQVPISIQMREEGFKFIVTKLGILNQEKYKVEQGIKIIDSKHTTLSKYQARIIYNDNTSKIISLYEEI